MCDFGSVLLVVVQIFKFYSATRAVVIIINAYLLT